MTPFNFQPLFWAMQALVRVPRNRGNGTSHLSSGETMKRPGI